MLEDSLKSLEFKPIPNYKGSDDSPPLAFYCHYVKGDIEKAWHCSFQFLLSYFINVI